MTIQLTLFCCLLLLFRLLPHSITSCEYFPINLIHLIIALSKPASHSVHFLFQSIYVCYFLFPTSPLSMTSLYYKSTALPWLCLLQQLCFFATTLSLLCHHSFSSTSPFFQFPLGSLLLSSPWDEMLSSKPSRE